jgi:hypothetical protein
MVNLARFCRCVAVQPVCISSLSSNHHLSFLFTASRVRFDLERYESAVELTIVAARSFLSFTVVFEAFNSLDVHSFLPSTHLFNRSTTHFASIMRFSSFVSALCVAAGLVRAEVHKVQVGMNSTGPAVRQLLLLALYAQANLLLILACIFTQ